MTVVAHASEKPTCRRLLVGASERLHVFVKSPHGRMSVAGSHRYRQPSESSSRRSVYAPISGRRQRRSARSLPGPMMMCTCRQARCREWACICACRQVTKSAGDGSHEVGWVCHEPTERTSPSRRLRRNKLDEIVGER